MKKNLKKNRLLENYYKLPKGQRIQLKKYLCILAVAFLLFLLFLNLLHSCGREGTDTPEMLETSPQHIPVVQKLKNVWITDAEADRITIFCDGEKRPFSWRQKQKVQILFRHRSRCGNSWRM